MNVEQEIQEYDPTYRYIKTPSELGRGAYKVVYRAIDRDLGIEVAWNEIKIVQDADFDKLWKEIDILKKFNHPNVLVCHHSWVDEKNLKIVFITECMTSCTLRQFVQKAKSVKLKVIKNWCKQILEGLNYLHTLDPPIIHRDIKCDNIFIDGNSGRVKIGDLGLATTIINNCSRNKLSIIGTPEFMAPEYYEEEYNEKVDIWAFGMCVLEMATLEYPFKECDNPAQIFKKVIHGHKPLSLYRIIDKDVYDFISECLMPVEERKSASELLKHEFLQNIDSESNNRMISLRDKPLILDESDPKEKDAKQVNTTLSSDGGDIYMVMKSQSLNIDLKSKYNRSRKIYSDINCNYNSKIKPILVESPDDSQKDIDITVHSQTELNSSSRHLLTLRLSLGVGSELTCVEFEYDQVKDTPTDVAKEMVRELDLSESSIEDISEYIEAKVEEYYENLHKSPSDRRSYVLKRSYSEGEPLIVIRKKDDETFLSTQSLTSPYYDQSFRIAPDSSVNLDESDESSDLVSIDNEEKSDDELTNFKLIVESNNASCNAALRAFEKKLKFT